jgi:ATP/maltotriose-dependent transcriptional regulator MalT
VDACLTAASALASTGRLSAAMEVSERGLAAHTALEGASLPLGPHFHRHIQCRALTCAGWLGEAETLARASYRQAVADEATEAQGAFAMSLARTLLQRGAVGEAERFARVGVGLLRDRRSPFIIRLALMPLAHASALLGRPDEARATLREIDELGLPANALQGPELLQIRAWAEIVAGDIPGGQRLLREAAAMAAEGGELVYQGAALHDLARTGRAKEALPGLEELAGLVEGPLIQARASHAAALVGGNPEALEAVSASFEQMGADLLAAEAAADAAVAWRKAQDPRRATAAERRMSALADRCEGARTPALATSGLARGVLTARELEIARLAAEGVPNREIAERLFLSLHTVQNKLHVTYDKLGVEGRAELKQALEGR